MGKESYLFVGQDRTPSDLVRRHLEQHHVLHDGLLELLGEQSLDDAYEAFDASPEDETDRLKPSLHDYLIKLIRAEYSSPPEGLEYNMSMANRYIVGKEVGEGHQSEAILSLVEEVSNEVCLLFKTSIWGIKVYALNR